MISLIAVQTQLCRSSLNRGVRSASVPTSVLRMTRRCHALLLRTITRASSILVRGCLRKRMVSPSRVVRTLQRKAVGTKVIPILYNSTFGGENVRLLLSTIMSCLPTPVSIPTVRKTLPGNRLTRHPTSSRTPLTTLTFGVVTSPCNHLAFIQICSKILGGNDCVCGTAGSGGRQVSHLVILGTSSHVRIRRLETKSLNTTVKLERAFANSAVYSPKRPVILRSLFIPRPIVSITMRPGAGRSVSGLSGTLRSLSRRSPAFHIDASPRAGRAIVTKVKRLRLSVLMSQVLQRFGIRTGVKTPRITCQRAVHRTAGTRNHFVHRDNNGKRCNRIIMRIRPQRRKDNFRFISGVMKKAVPGRCVPPTRRNVGRTYRSNVLTKCPMVSLGIALASKSCRRMSSSRVTFGVTKSVTVGRTIVGTSPILLRPVVGIRIRIPRSFLNSIVKSLGSQHNRVRNVKSRTNITGIATSIPLTRVFNCTASVHSGARNQNVFSVRFDRCNRIPQGITRTVVSGGDKGT